jgi:platelet-activating factor acetylhydrolase
MLEQERFPVAIFSHGLGGIRTTYSSICCELASRGMIVVALEHRDGSASMTVDRDGRVFPYVTGPSGVTLPMVDYEFRAAQMRHRINEIRAALTFLQKLNESGKADSIVNASSWLKGLKGRLWLDRLSLIGHSFGGATCLAAAQQLLKVSCCVAFDPWMFPMPQPHLQVHRTDIDTLVVMNENFSWPENDFAIQKFMEAMRGTELKNTKLGQVCLLGCGHMDQSDLSSIVPARIIQMIRPKTVMPTTPHNIIQVNVDLTAAHLAASFPMFHFDAAYSMAELEERLRKDSETCTNTRINLAKLLIKIETFNNYCV